MLLSVILVMQKVLGPSCNKRNVCYGIIHLVRTQNFPKN